MGNLDCFRIGLINPFSEYLSFSSILIDQVNIIGGNSISPWRTLLSTEFLNWRYKNPMYQVAYFPAKESYIIYRKSIISKIPVLIIYELIGNPIPQGFILNSLAKKYKTPFVYYYGDHVKNGKFLISFKKNNPVVIIKDDKHFIVDKLSFSLGDLEGKI